VVKLHRRKVVNIKRRGVVNLAGKSTESKEEADKLFNGLSEGGQVEMTIADSPWGSYFGMFRDKYGIEWMVDFDPKYKGQL